MEAEPLFKRTSDKVDGEGDAKRQSLAGAIQIIGGGINKEELNEMIKLY